MSSSASIEALAMAGADYVECNLEFQESSLPPPHLLADGNRDVEGEELWRKLQIIKRSMSPHQSKNVHYQPAESIHADHVLKEDIATMNLSCRKDEEEVVIIDVSKLLSKFISFTTFFKKEKLEAAIPASCQEKGEIYVRRSLC